jgi:6-phosphogluconolactonase
MGSQDKDRPLAGIDVSRRTLLQGAALLVAAGPVASLANDDGNDGDDRPGVTLLTYISGYTPNGLGIALYSMDSATGKLTFVKVAAASAVSPSWMALHPHGKFLYTANETDNFNGTTNGSVSAYAVNRATGDLTLLNTVSSQGGGPVYVSIDPLGQFVLVANYTGGSVAVLPILADGSLGNATDVQADVGSVGPLHATDGPPGSFAVSGHDAPHAHMIQTDASGKFVVHADLGQDRLYSWTLQRAGGKLIANSAVSLPPGDGPRHFSFHPNGQWLYCAQEEASTLTLFGYDPGTGLLTKQQTVSTLSKDFVGTSFASEVRVSADGRFVYVANRLADSIAIFAVDADTGLLRRVGEEWTRGDYPRSFTIDPTGRFLLSCNQRSDAVTTFRIEDGGRQLRFTGQYVAVGSPACILFLA